MQQTLEIIGPGFSCATRIQIAMTSKILGQCHSKQRKASVTKADPYCRLKAEGPMGTLEAVTLRQKHLEARGFVFDTVVYVSQPLEDLSGFQSTLQERTKMAHRESSP